MTQNENNATSSTEVLSEKEVIDLTAIVQDNEAFCDAANIVRDRLNLLLAEAEVQLNDPDITVNNIIANALRRNVGAWREMSCELMRLSNHCASVTKDLRQQLNHGCR